MEELKLLGKRTKDSVTGIEGIVSSVAFFSTTEPRCQIEFVDKNGVANSIWVDVARAMVDQ